MNTTTYQIETFWDSEAQVWVATSDDIFGLATEANSWEDLRVKLKVMIPELLRINHQIWYSPINQKRFVVDQEIKSRHTANAVLKQAGLPKSF